MIPRLPYFLLMTVLLVGSGLPALAGDDPSIQGELRQKIQQSMTQYIDQMSVDGTLRQYDPVSGEPRELEFQELHDGIVRKGDFYVSCADFLAPDGTLVDLDFLVLPDGDEVKAVQAVVHAVDGEKRPYDLESR